MLKSKGLILLCYQFIKFISFSANVFNVYILAVIIMVVWLLVFVLGIEPCGPYTCSTTKLDMINKLPQMSRESKQLLGRKC